MTDSFKDNMLNEEKLWLVPLINLESNVEKARLDDRTAVARMSSDELKRLHDVPYNPVQKAGILKATHAINTKGKDPLGSVKSLILSLRLLKKGDVKYSFAFTRSRGKGLEAIHTGFGRLDFSTNKYYLDKKDLEELKTLWKSSSQLSKKPYLSFSTNRFMESYDKKDLTDKIVNFTAAFESIVFYNKDKSIEPAGEVMGIAVAMLLGKNQNHRDEIKERLIKVYEIRNAIVHGNVKRMKDYFKPDSENNIMIEEIARKAEDMLRLTLRKLIEE